MYELFDHTADLGIRIVADDLDALFREAAEALVAVVFETVPDATPELRLEFRLEADRLDHLLVDWLGEILYAIDTRRLVPRSFEVRVGQGRLSASASAFDRETVAGAPAREVKAVTYHGLVVERSERGWRAEVILDI